MKLIRILVDSFADAGLPNAQMGNAREIVSRLDPERFHVSIFALGKPDARIGARKNTRLIQLPPRRQTVRILSEFLWGDHRLLFYLKPSPASRCYQGMRKKWRDRRITIGTVESQSDARNEPSISAEGIRLWERTVLCCDYLFSNSENVRCGLAREYGRESTVIPTGVDTLFFSPDWDRSPNPRLQVLFVGSLRAFKQPQFLLAAAPRFPHVDFRIAGQGPLASELASLIARENLSNVRLLGSLNAEELRNEYRRADVFLFPSSWEGSPKVILEAAACGLPVLVRNNYSPETVIHGLTGFQARSNEEIYSFLQALISNQELRNSLGRAGRLHSQKFDWDVITQQWARTFIDLAGSSALRHAS